jgi:hypothetical protein
MYVDEYGHLSEVNNNQKNTSEVIHKNQQINKKYGHHLGREG